MKTFACSDARRRSLRRCAPAQGSGPARGTSATAVDGPPPRPRLSYYTTNRGSAVARPVDRILQLAYALALRRQVLALQLVPARAPVRLGIDARTPPRV